MTLRLGIVGYGTIASAALDALAASGAGPLSAVAILAQPSGRDRALALLDRLGDALSTERRVFTDAADFAGSIDFAIEAAGHGAVRAHGPTILARGVDLVITSTGALSDGAVRTELDASANLGGARYTIHGGAIGGLDLLEAASLAGLDEVIYTSRKPPRAWMGTPAEQACDLAKLTAPHVFYEGDALAAARDYPQNANVAATIALKGPGFSATRVRLIADPAATRNTHEIRIVSKAFDATIEIAGHPAPNNPKTSATTAFSLASTVLARLKRG